MFPDGLTTTREASLGDCGASACEENGFDSVGVGGVTVVKGVVRVALGGVFGRFVVSREGKFALIAFGLLSGSVPISFGT